MYCSNCGKELNQNDRYCANCGTKIDNIVDISTEVNVSKSAEGSRTASIVLGILSLVGIFIAIFAPISVVLSIIGLILAIKANKVYKNTAGIVLNSIGLLLSFIITSIIALIIMFSYDIIKNNFNNFNIHEYIEEYQEESSDKF